MNQPQTARLRSGLGAISALVAGVLISPALGPASPSYVYQHLTVTDGLPVNNLTDLVQTPDGYLWISTYDGLARFDGNRFTVFRMSNTPAFATDRFIELHAARDSSLWIATEGFGVVRMKDDRFTRYPMGTSALKRYTPAFYEDSRGDIWIAGDRGIHRFSGGQMSLFMESTDGLPIRAVAHDDGGSLCWLTDGGLFRNDGSGARKLASLPERDPAVDMVLGPDGALWISTAFECFRFQRSLEPLRPPGALPPMGRFLIDGRSGWLSAANGVFRYEDGTWRLHVPTRDLSRPLIEDAGRSWYAVEDTLFADGEPILSDGSVPARAVRDHEDNIWVVSLESGLYRFSPSVFQVFGVEEGLPDRSVYSIYEDRPGEFLFGLTSPFPGNGLARLHAGRAEAIPGFSWVFSIHRDRQDRLWVGGGPPFLARADGAGPLRPAPGSPLESNVYVIYEDREGTLWFGTADGLFRLRGEHWERLGPESGLPDRYVRSIRETDHGLWMGTNGGGVVHFDGTRFAVIDTSQGLSSMNVRGIFEDSEGVLWIGTEGMGLNRTTQESPAAPAITVIGIEDGLYDNVIHDILEDDQGRLWMNSNRGIFWCLRSELEEFARGHRPRVSSVAYTESDGLRSREGNGGCQPAATRDSSGRLWFPTVDGAAVLDPSTVRLDKPPPPLVIEGVRIGEDRRSFDPAGISLARGERTFEIAYTAMAFRDAKSLEFRYRLEGLDADWVEVGNRRTAYYTHVPPGRHRFHVTASHGPSRWGKEATLLLTVPPYFHETPWFRGFVVLVLLGSAYLFYRYRMRIQRLRLKAVTLEVERRRRAEDALRQLGQRLISAQEDERRRLSRDLHDDLSQRLALLNIEISMLGRQSGEDVSELEALAGDLADDLRRLSHNLHPGKLEQVGIVTGLSSLCRELSGKTDIEVSFRNETETLDVAPEIGLCIYRIAQEGLRNSWKYSGADKATVTLEESNGNIVLTVADRGRGFDLEAESEAGLGILSMTERARSVGGDLSIESTPGGGTKIRLTVPSDRLESGT